MSKRIPITEIHFPNGDRYSGDIKNGMMNGTGKLTLANGDTYEGQFKNNKFDGQGRYTFSRSLHPFDYGVYSGNFKDGKRNGKGTLKFSKSMSFLNADYDSELWYEGNVEKFSPDEQYLHYGETYVGEFKNNLFYGNEIKDGLDNLCWDYHTVSGEGLWKDDQFLEIKVKAPTMPSEIKYPDYSESDGFSETTEKTEPQTPPDKKEEKPIEQNLQPVIQKPVSMVKFSIPDMIDDIEILSRIKEIPDLKITRYEPPVAYITNVTGEDVEFEFQNFHFAAETYPDYYLWTFYVDSQCPESILSKFISYLQKEK